MSEKEYQIEEIREEWPTSNAEEKSAFEVFCADFLAEKEKL